MRYFPGFDDHHTVPVPEQFFREVMPHITDRAELILVLYVFWLSHHAGPDAPFFCRRDLAADARLMAALQDAERSPEEALDDALTQAVARGVLLHLQAQATADSEEEDWYCLNTAANRERVRALADGYREHVGGWAMAMRQDLPQLRPARPNIFVLYEQTIGMLNPLIADELREAEKTYPAEWIEEAFRIAAERNVRNWRYVRAILERWAREGRDEEDRRGGEQDPRRYISGPYGHLIQH